MSGELRRLDPVIELYKKDVDRTLLRENLKLSVEERCEKFAGMMKMYYELRSMGERMRAEEQVARSTK